MTFDNHIPPLSEKKALPLKLVLIPKLTNPFICRFFNPRYAFDTGVLALGSFVRHKVDVKIKSIFGHIGRPFPNKSDMEKISGQKYLDSFVHYVLKGRPDVIGISCIDTCLANAVVLSQAIKKQSSTVKIVLGGPGVFYHHTDLMHYFTCIDYCIIGEGEIAFSRLMDHLNNKIPIDQVPGLAYRGKDKVLVTRPPRLMDVNDLPCLCLDLYDLPSDHLDSLACETGRGCPHKCTFCSTTAFWGNHFRVKTPQRIVDEIALYCRDHKKLSHFDFHSHDNFLTHKTYIKSLFYELKKRNLNISWNCSSRIDRLDHAFIELLKKSGCNYIDCGPESGSQRIRDLIRKDIHYEATLDNMKQLIKANIGVAVNFMFGFPTETIKELEQTFDQACRCVTLGADIVFCFLSPIKGTKIYEQFHHLLVDKGQDHLHDFTDARANYLFGTNALCKVHPFFTTHAKMFSNDKGYNALVKKIRSTDSVFIFTHLSDILLALKQQFNINIHESKTALKKFPYSQDLIAFALKKAKDQSIAPRHMAEVLAKAVHKRQEKQAGGLHA